jgi:hypothetical protein
MKIYNIIQCVSSNGFIHTEIQSIIIYIICLEILVYCEDFYKVLTIYSMWENKFYKCEVVSKLFIIQNYHKSESFKVKLIVVVVLEI